MPLKVNIAKADHVGHSLWPLHMFP